MQLHTLQRSHRLKKSSVRVGRGGKRGTTSGRGQKGQHAHAGRKVPTGLKELLRRLPKLRGINNKSRFVKPIALNLGRLAALLPKLKTTVITQDVLRKEGIISAQGETVKILGEGELTSAITVEGLAVSKSAKEKIEAAGGKVK